MRSTLAILLTTTILVISAMFFVALQPASAAPAEYVPVTVTQPDGTELHLFASGDEYYNWLHDAEGYTVIQDPETGYYVYADLADGKLVPTHLIPDQDDPAAAGLVPQLNISPEARTQIRSEFLALAPDGISDAPSTGTVTNLVIFICFADPDPCFLQSGEPSPVTEQASKYTQMLNTGTSSLKSYFQEASYSALTINSQLFPTPDTYVVAYHDSQPRGYYQPYSATNTNGYSGGNNGSERTTREFTLLRNAIAYVNGLGQFPPGATIDADGDGVVDDVTFIVSGSPTGWASLLWPHAWSLYTWPYSYISDKRVYGFNLQMQSMTDVGVLAHETYHVVGAPDLYRYYNNFQPVGPWDVMEMDFATPQHMGCHMKWKYGHWISSIPEITTTGTYTLNPMGPSGECYKIASPNSSTEYFVLEYRRDEGTFESSLPASGLLIYRINTAVGNGNASGPPDEVYVYRPDGTAPEVNGSVNQANYSATAGRTAINDCTNPSSFLTNGSPGGLYIDSVGTPGATISFHYGGPTGSGVYEIAGNAGTPGATLSYMDCSAKTAAADGSGHYSFKVSSGWSGSVTPSKPGYVFSPPSRLYGNVLADQLNQDFTATYQPAPTITAEFPAGGSTTCRRPTIGVTLGLTTLVRDTAGSFDPSTVVLQLDGGSTLMNLTSISQGSAYPATKATMLFTPASNLSQDWHTATLTYPSPTGPQTHVWSFYAALANCSMSTPVQGAEAQVSTLGGMADVAGGVHIPTAEPPVPAAASGGGFLTPYRRLLLVR